MFLRVLVRFLCCFLPPEARAQSLACFLSRLRVTRLKGEGKGRRGVKGASLRERRGIPILWLFSGGELDDMT